MKGLGKRKLAAMAANGMANPLPGSRLRGTIITRSLYTNPLAKAKAISPTHTAHVPVGKGNKDKPIVRQGKRFSNK